MQKKAFNIDNIPSIIWGDNSDKLIVAVHGSMSNKEDVPIKILANKAVKAGYQVLSFDLPKHGDRKDEDTPCKVQECVENLQTIMNYAKGNWKHISLFANSIGAYFSLLAYKDEDIESACFLSPVVDMQRIIRNMMKWFNVSEERLRKEEVIPTPIGETLYWDYYCYVNEHPIQKWEIPTYILRGEKDEMCEGDTILKFNERFACKLKTVKEAEHYFHTTDQLKALNKWIEKALDNSI